jgi:ElaB/YqjD/DUF883 family membrane-anchored ribosome-binding protein
VDGADSILSVLHFLAENTFSLNEYFTPPPSIELASRDKDLRTAAERSIRETRKDFDKKIDEIRGDLKEGGTEAVQKAERALNELKEDLESSFGQIHERFEEGLETGRSTVREHPLLSVGIAVGVGVIIGMLLERKGRD